MSSPGRRPALDKDLPPTIGIDPGSRNTGLAVRIGSGQRSCLAATTVHNDRKPRPGGHRSLIPFEPADVRAIIIAAGVLMRDHDQAARNWWTDHGVELAPTETPWLVAIEGAVVPVENHARGWVVGPAEMGSYASLQGIYVALAVAFGESVRRVAPHLADTRWQADQRNRGTGNPADYWPANLLDARHGGTLDPAVSGSTKDNYAVPLNHVRAAFHVATDGAEDYLRDCERLHGRLVPPSQGCPRDVIVPRLLSLRGAVPAAPAATPEPYADTALTDALADLVGAVGVTLTPGAGDHPSLAARRVLQIATRHPVTADRLARTYLSRCEPTFRTADEWSWRVLDQLDKLQQQ